MEKQEEQKPQQRWVWTRTKIQAAQMIAEDDLSDMLISKKLGVSNKTIWNWKQYPEFIARVNQIMAAWNASMMNSGLARKEKRLEALKKMHAATSIITEERAFKYGAKTASALKLNGVAIDPDEHTKEELDGAVILSVPAIAGGGSGYIVTEKRMTGFGETAMMVEDAVFDANLYRAQIVTLEKIREETGQAVSKHELTGKDGGPIQMSIGVFDDLVERVRAARAADGAARQASSNQNPGS